jgi:hypothetical protein
MVQFQHKRITNPSITHTDKLMHALADCVKAIQGMTGNARNSQATQDLQYIIDATQAHSPANPNKFEETITLDNTRNTQQVPRVQAPPSIPKPHINGNRRITHSLQLQTPILRVPTNKTTGNPISAPLIATTIKPTGKPACPPNIKPTTLPADLSKRERLCKRQATQLCTAANPTSPTPHIRTQAQVTTAATRVAPPSSNTRSRTQPSGMPPPTRWPGFATAPMASTRTCSPHTPHHTPGEQSPSSNDSNGQGHWQAPQLQATNEQPEMQKSMEPFSSQ